MSRLRVAWFGSYDRGVGRNAILQDALHRVDVDVLEVHAPVWSDTGAKLSAARGSGMALGAGLRQAGAWLSLLRQRKSLASAHLIIVGPTAHLDLPLARRLADRLGIPLVFDPLVSIGETLRDRALARPGSFKMQALSAVERKLFALPDCVLVDTEAHAMAFANELGLDPARVVVVPAGAAAVFRERATTYAARMPGPDAPLRVVYAGQYIPLHGLETVLGAAEALRDREDILFELVGRGQVLPSIRAGAEALNLPNLRFADTWIPPEDLADDHFASADICLGIFGDQPKAQRVVPYKVYSALAAGRPVITADTPAIREMLKPGDEVWTLPPADAGALAEAISLLAKNPELRSALASAGQAAWDQRFSPEVVGGRLRDALETVLRPGG